MSTYTETVGKKLNNLLVKTYDAEKGFKKAAENTQNNYLKDYFQKKAQERYAFGHELKSELNAFGQDPDKGGSLTGQAHRTWMDVKAMFSADDEEAMLEEAIRGEKAAVSEYDDVLNETTLPVSTKAILSKHKSTIESGLNAIKRLEDIS